MVDAAILVISADHPDYGRVAELTAARLTTVRLCTVTAAVATSWTAVLVRADAGNDGQAAVEAGALLAAARSAPLVVDPGPRAGRRVDSLVSDISRAGVEVVLGRDAGPGALVLAPDRGPAAGPAVGAHITVRAEADFTPADAAEWARAVRHAGPVPVSLASSSGQPAEAGA
jgi:hypothetical protein